MGRRSDETTLQPHKLVESYGEPTPGVVRALLLHAQQHHKNREHHETGAHIMAALLALDQYLQFAQDSCEKSRELARTWRYMNSNNAPAAAAHVALGNVNKKEPGREIENGRYGNNTANIPCLCGHGTALHDGAGHCRLCNCDGMQHARPHQALTEMLKGAK